MEATVRLAVPMSCTAEELKRRVQEGIRAGLKFRALRAQLVEFAAGGGRREVAGAVLEELAVELGRHDAVLDLLDVACGFCEPKLRVWTDECYRHVRTSERAR